MSLPEMRVTAVPLASLVTLAADPFVAPCDEEPHAAINAVTNTASTSTRPTLRTARPYAAAVARVVTVVPHTHWDREWYAPFQTFRLRLVDLLDDVLPRLDAKGALPHF